MVPIHVYAEEPVGAQARGYAEYRVFAALVQLTRRVHVRQARVTLRQAPRPGACRGIECAIALDVGDTTFTVRACADHPYAAINRAADRLTPRGLGTSTQSVAV
jgi:ribosome-associated translation inhibitor RaiA